MGKTVGLTFPAEKTAGKVPEEKDKKLGSAKPPEGDKKEG